MESSVFDAKMMKEIMERKLQEKDLRGAILLARRVQNLYPQLKRLFQFLGNIVVPVSIEDEEIDWYTVLGVHPTVDCKTMKQHYVELVRVITEAESYEAYKIVDKAWLILSNMYERKAYDKRRRSREMQLNALWSTTKEKMNIGENIYAPLPSTASWSSNMTIQPGIDNVLGMYANVDPRRAYKEGDETYATKMKAPSSYCRELWIGLPSVAGSDGANLTKLKEKMGLAESTFTPQQPNVVWSDKINAQPGMHGVSRNYTSPLASVFPATQLIQSVSVNSKKACAYGDLTLATKAKTSCIDSKESRIGLPHVAGSIGIKMSSVEKVHGSSINVPHNQMDAAGGVKQMGNPPTKKVGVSRIRKGNSKKNRRSDEETSFLVRIARNEIRKKLDEWRRPRIKYTYSRRNKSQNLPYNVFGSIEGRGGRDFNKEEGREGKKL